MIDYNSKAAKPFMSRNMTLVLKGIAIILMIVHHFFTTVNYYPESFKARSSQDWIHIADLLNSPTRICVGIFAFITGYVYYYSNKKTLLYSANKIWHLYIRFWVIAVPLVALALMTNDFSFSFSNILIELLGFTNKVMRFSWYVPFYAFAMLLLPLLFKLMRTNSNIINNLILIIVMLLPFNLVAGILFTLWNGHELVLLFISYVWLHTPIVISGYIVAQSDCFSFIHNRIMKLRPYLRIIVVSLAAITAIVLKYIRDLTAIRVVSIGGFPYTILFYNDVFIVPIFLFALIELFSCHESGIVCKALAFLGKHSTNIWFWHCMFFGVTGYFFKPVLYAPGNPILIFIWGMTICVLLSIATNRTLQLINKTTRRLSDKHKEKNAT